MSRLQPARHAGSPRLSAEIFPPAEPQARKRLCAALSDAAPHYVSVTFGAGGTTRDRTFDMVELLARQPGTDVAAHLTCVGVARDDVDGVVRRYRDLGIRRIVALRGDPPAGLDLPYSPHPHGYARTADLVRGILTVADFDIAVACYPETHPGIAVPGDRLRPAGSQGRRRRAQRDLPVLLRQQYLSRPSQPRAQTRHRHPYHPGNTAGDQRRPSLCVCEEMRGNCPRLATRPLQRPRRQPRSAPSRRRGDRLRQIAELHEAGIDEFHIYCLNRPSLLSAIRSQLALPDPAAVAA